MLSAPMGQCRACSALADALGVAAAASLSRVGDLAHELVMNLSTHAPPAIPVLGCRDIKDQSDKQMNLATLSLPCF